jgi:hypothetical protein
MAVYERLGATYAAAFSRVKVAALFAHLLIMRAYRSFYRRHRTRVLVAMRAGACLHLSTFRLNGTPFLRDMGGFSGFQ